MAQTLPKFDNPPVVETVYGVEFEPLESWQVPHFGLYWSRIQHKYQKCAVQPPLADRLEKFDGEPQEVKINISLLAAPSVRCWFFDNEENWLLQVQNNRFISNWRRKPTSYPHYKGFIERFETEWDRFRDFAEKQNIGEPKLLQCEVTYINHIEVDIKFDNLGEIFPVWNGFRDNSFLPAPEGLSINTVFLIPENRGRLYINMQPVFRHSDAKVVLQLSVSAKVRLASNSKTGMNEALKLGHDWVVCGFADFTSAKIHETWQRRL
jgi:uncharacterized protein (TIGR04255 family)